MAGISTDEFRPGRALMNADSMTSLRGGELPQVVERDFERFFSFVNRIQPTFHTPSGALLFHGCLAAGLVLTGTFEEIYSLGIFSIWIFVGLTALALIGLRKKEPALPRPYRAWGYPWTPLIVATVAFGISANLWVVRPVRSSIGIVVILLGIRFFGRWEQQAADRLVGPVSAIKI
jgi:basic amino acid/polyamine antiporter, APA family